MFLETFVWNICFSMLEIALRTITAANVFFLFTVYTERIISYSQISGNPKYLGLAMYVYLARVLGFLLYTYVRRKLYICFDRDHGATFLPNAFHRQA